MTPDFALFERPELFEIDTWGRQADDLHTVIQATHYGDLDRSGSWDESNWSVVYFGHSRGGVTSTLAAGRNCEPAFYEQYWPGLKRSMPPTALITAAAPDYACNLDDLAKEQLRTEGRLLSPSGRTGQDLYVGKAWLDEIDRDPELYDPVLAAAHVKCPTLIIHGSGDTTVPVECAHNLHRAATPNSRLEIIDGASHVFDCPNPLPIDTPWAEVPAATRELIDLTVAYAVEQCEKARSA
ncbi:alpha/beta hydrolase [Phycisphaeraceae bacterium D3-23]